MPERIPLYQDGPALSHDLLKLSTNGLLSNVGGLDGDENGRSANPFGITTGNLPGSVANVPGLGLSFNSDRTDLPYSALSLGHDSDHNGLIALDSYNGLAAKVLRFRINGTIYEWPASGGNVLGPAPTVVGHVATWNDTTGELLADSGIIASRLAVGPVSSTVNELASWNNTTGSLLRQGAATLTDNKTTAFVGDGGSLSVFSKSGVTAQHIWTSAIGTPDAPGDPGNFDGIRSVVVAADGQSTSLATAVAGYLLNQVPRTGPSYPSFPVAAVINAIGIGDADGSGTWGINTIVSDNVGRTVSAHGARFLFGAEFDVQATSPNTSVSGVMTGGNSLVQPIGANGYSVLWLDGASQGGVAKWAAGFISQDGSAVNFLDVGAKEAGGNNIASQDISLRYLDGAGARRVMSAAALNGVLLLADSVGAASLALSGAGAFRVGDGGGLNINNRAVVAAIGAALSVGSDANHTTQNYSNGSAATTIFGTSVALDAANATASGILTVTGEGRFTGGIATSTAGSLVRSTVAMTNGAGAGAGTLTNAPAAGDPTKWIPINDGGVTRYLPAW
jgi:hypothetical protein